MGGSISPSGEEVLLKTYNEVYYWKRLQGEPLSATLKRTGQSVAYHSEPQGEAVCWDSTGSGYFTLSEGVNQPLYYYAREDGDPNTGSEGVKKQIGKGILLMLALLWWIL